MISAELSAPAFIPLASSPPTAVLEELKISNFVYDLLL